MSPSRPGRRQHGRRRPPPQPTVFRDDNRITFGTKVNDPAVREFLYTLREAFERGYEDVVVDFSLSEVAYPDSMLQVISTLEVERSRGLGVDVVMPENHDLARLFSNTNWAHFLAPELHSAVTVPHERHMGVRRFVEFSGQQDVVNTMMDIVMGNMELERDVLTGLEWSFNEITDNVLNHSDAGERGGLAEVSTFPDSGIIKFVVSDSGRGIMASMQPGHPSILNDAVAIEEAIKAGVTRDPNVGQGNGLAGTLRIATMSGGSLTITSGQAQLRVYRPDGQRDYTQRVHPRRSPRLALTGTTVAVELATDPSFHLTDALGFTSADSGQVDTWDVIDSRFTDEERDVRVLRIADQGGVGTRQAGAQVRTLSKNLLAADATKRLVIDWGGVPVVSSSFADELVGRLFVEMGPMAFMTRVVNVGMEPLVRSLVDHAVLQRSSQSFGGPSGDGQ